VAQLKQLELLNIEPERSERECRGPIEAPRFARRSRFKVVSTKEAFGEQAERITTVADSRTQQAACKRQEDPP
jgi:hypothetical protein